MLTLRIVAAFFLLVLFTTTSESKTRHHSHHPKVPEVERLKAELAAVKRELKAVREQMTGRRDQGPRTRVAALEAGATDTKRSLVVPFPAPPPIWVPVHALENVGHAVDDYLCEVYNRMPFKIDGSGDFSWKDKSAAERKGMSVCEYVVGGMNPGFRESLYQLGQVLDGDGVRWSFLSGFRDDYRQRIASGFKAGPCGSWHGGSCRTKGYGDGRAADLWVAGEDGKPTGNANPLFRVIDRIGASLGLSRPMPGNDPAHVQVAGGSRQIAARRKAKRTARAE